MFKHILTEQTRNETTFPCICQIQDPFNNVARGEYFVVDSLVRTSAKYYHLNIVDTEAIIETDDWYFDCWEKKLIKSKFGTRYTQYMGYDVKVIASTDVSLGLPIIPETYIQDMVNHTDSPILKYEIHGGCFIPFIDYHYKERNKSQVDFEMLKVFVSEMIGFGVSETYIKKVQNLQLFFEKLKSDADFAILVHQKLQ